MKSVIKNQDVTKKKDDYPCLKIHIDDGYVVMFTHRSKGIVISENIHYTLGYVSTFWDIDQFKTFNGTIELSN